MAGGKLEVQIGADVTDFKKKIQEVEFDIKELSKVKLDRLKVGLDTTAINAQIKDAKNSLSTLRDSVGKTGSAIGGQFTKQTANGSNALMQFSRIAQDAPYGIIGIGNNITATAESFGYLKQQTGSTSGALKAMASSLMGTGGILLGVSLLTTGFTLLAQSGLSVGDVINKITGNFDDLSASIKKATEEGQKQAGQEIQSLKELVAVAQNDAIAKKDRLIAVEKLQTQFPVYYGNLSAEKILYGDLTRETNLATQALLARGIAEKLSAKAGDKFIERLQAQQKFNDAKKKVDELEEKVAKARLANESKASGQNAQILARLINLRNDAVSAANEERDAVAKLERGYVSIGNVINKLNQIGAPLDRKAPKGSNKTTTKKEKINPNAGNEFRPFLEGNISSSLVPEIALTFKDPTDGFLEFNSKVALGLTTTQQAILDFNDTLSSIVTNGTVNALAGIGESIGTALSSGGNVIEAVGKSILGSMGSMLQELGKATIAYGVGLIAVKTAIKNPYTAIAAGVAMVAIGSAISGAVSKSSKALDGGGGSASSSTGSGANNSSFSSGGFSGSSSTGGGTYVFEIAGQKLISVLSNTLNANKRLGGQTTLLI
jgi:hypothetical protein